MAMDAGQKGESSTSAELIWMIVTPLIFTIGVVGNTFTVTVLQQRKNKTSSTSTYLTCLAIADLCHLVIVLPRWWIIYVFAYDIRHSHDFTCRMHIFITFVSGTWSSFFLVALTIERILSTTTPHTVRLICAPRVANKVAMLIFLIPALLTTHALYGYGLIPKPPANNNEITDQFDDNATEFDGAHGYVTDKVAVFDATSKNLQDLSTVTIEAVTDSLLMFSSTPDSQEIRPEQVQLMCSPDRNPSYARVYKMVLEPVHSMLYGVVPEVVFLIAAIVITRKLAMGRRFRSKLTEDSTRSDPNGSDARTSVSKGSVKIDGRINQVTATLLVVNITFVVCTTPIGIFLAVSSTWVDKAKGMTSIQQTVWAIVNMLWFTNHAVNFILYVLVGSKFRNQALDLIRSWRNKDSPGNIYRSNSKTATTSVKSESGSSNITDEKF